MIHTRAVISYQTTNYVIKIILGSEGLAGMASDGAAATQYPGYRWDATAQQWVADPASADAGAASAAGTNGYVWDSAAQQWVFIAA